MKSRSPFVKHLIEKVKELSDATGFEHRLSFGDGVYGLDVGSKETWEVSNMSYPQIDSYLSGLILGVRLMKENESFCDDILNSVAESRLCSKMDISCKGEFVLRKIGSSEEWDDLVLMEKEILKSNGR